MFWRRLRRVGGVAVAAGSLFGIHPAAVQAQDEAVVEALAPILAAEDARNFDLGLYSRALENAEPLVRRTAALSLGRLGDSRGVPLLLARISDPDSTVQTNMLFALGLLADSSAAGPIIDRYTAEPALAPDPALEGITALARIGGPDAAIFFSGLLRGTAQFTVQDPGLRQRAAEEAWRLGSQAPVGDLLPLTHDTAVGVRVGAVYSLSRLRAREAAPQFLDALRDEEPLVRAYAVRVLTRSWAEGAGVAQEVALAALRRVLNDQDPGVRINTLRALATWRAPELSTDIVRFLDDQDVNVRVQAANALGSTGGPAAVSALRDLLRSRQVWALRREALLSAARVDTALLREAAPVWAPSADWRDRAVLAEAWASVGTGLETSLAGFLTDPDPRVVAAALQAWNSTEREVSPSLEQAARRAASGADAAVRSVAADVLARVKRAADIPLLVTLYRRSARDSFPEAALSALAALDSISRTDSAAALRVQHEFLDVMPRPSFYLIRRWAEASWPEAAERWGSAFPIETGRTLQDYRGLARQYLVGSGPEQYPHVVIETEQRGPVELELFGPDAPLTVANFLLLVDRHFFDGNQWHRVVPNFVVQDGDPRGDGWGGPGGAIRDEINRRRYKARILGMALSGPDTGSSQWFITLSPQPHLDGIYTVFGQVVGASGAIIRITQGDVIRTIRRG